MIFGKKILVTGGAGFIGSHLVDALLKNGNKVVVLDNFSTGFRANLSGAEKSPDFTLIEGDIRNIDDCRMAVDGCDYVLHEAALGSVPRSIAKPEETVDVNVRGFVNIITAAKDAGVKRFIYASSSSVYGDNPDPIKVEDRIGKPLSPYAVSKRCNELFAENFAKVYGLEVIGLRYFNVFGPRQNPDGPYAAVIPKFIKALQNHEQPIIYGDGSTSRDFTHVDNVVSANLLALEADASATNEIYNIACGKSTTLNELFTILSAKIYKITPVYESARQGDIAHSQADITKAKSLLGYKVLHTLE